MWIKIVVRKTNRSGVVFLNNFHRISTMQSYESRETTDVCQHVLPYSQMAFVLFLSYELAVSLFLPQKTTFLM